MAFCGGVAKNGVATFFVGFCYFVFIGVPWIICAKNVAASRRSASVFNSLSSGISWITCAKYDVLWWRIHARRRFLCVVSNVIPRLTCAKYGVFWRRRDDRQREAWCRFSMSLDGMPTFICAK
jgi:hypothetical protein